MSAKNSGGKKPKTTVLLLLDELYAAPVFKLAPYLFDSGCAFRHAGDLLPVARATRRSLR